MTLQEARARGFQDNVTIIHMLNTGVDAGYVKIYEKLIGISFPPANRHIRLGGAEMECRELLASMAESHQDAIAVGAVSFHSFSPMTADHALEQHAEEWASKATAPDADPCAAQLRRTVRAWRIAPYLRSIVAGWVSTHIGKGER